MCYNVSFYKRVVNFLIFWGKKLSRHSWIFGIFAKVYFREKCFFRLTAKVYSRKIMLYLPITYICSFFQIFIAKKALKSKKATPKRDQPRKFITAKFKDVVNRESFFPRNRKNFAVLSYRESFLNEEDKGYGQWDSLPLENFRSLYRQQLYTLCIM